MVNLSTLSKWHVCEFVLFIIITQDKKKKVMFIITHLPKGWNLSNIKKT